MPSVALAPSADVGECSGFSSLFRLAFERHLANLVREHDDLIAVSVDRERFRVLNERRFGDPGVSNAAESTTRSGGGAQSLVIAATIRSPEPTIFRQLVSS